jgi:hypothetical protein
MCDVCLPEDDSEWLLDVRSVNDGRLAWPGEGDADGILAA